MSTALAFTVVAEWQMRFDKGLMPAAGVAAQAANPPGLASSACSSTSAADLHLELPGAIAKTPLLRLFAADFCWACHICDFQSGSRVCQSIVWGRCQSTKRQQTQACSVKTCTAWLQAGVAAAAPVLVHRRPGRRLHRCWLPCSTWPASKAS